MMLHVWQATRLSLGVVALLLLAACPSQIPKVPALGTPTPNPLELNAEVNQSASGSIHFQNSGDAPLTYTASESAAWLEITAGSSGTVVPADTAIVDVKATCSATPKNLSTTLAITSDGGNKSMTVELSCTGAPELSEPTPNPLELNAEISMSRTKSIAFQNSGNIDLTYSVSETAGWLDVTAGASGTVTPGDTATVTLRATCPATPDNLTTTLTISSNDVDETSKGVAVNLSCSDSATAPEISNPMPNPLELSANVNQGDTGSITFENSGNADLIYNASESVSWLEIISGGSGTVESGDSAVIILEASCPATPDNLSTTLAIASNAGNKDVSVKLNCVAAPEIGDPVPNPLKLSAQINEGETGSISFQNSGDAPLGYTASESASWLEISAGASGTVAPAGKATIDLKANCPATPDNLSTILTISSNDIDEPSKAVAVTLGCSNPSNSVPEISNPTPNPLELNAEVNQHVGGSISFQNSGDALLTYTASESVAWLEMTSDASGTVSSGGNATIALSATCPATPGNLSTALALSSNGGNKSVTVNLNCTGVPEISSLTPNPLNFSAEVNENSTRAVTFENSGSIDLTYDASESASWLEITSGGSRTVAPGDTATVSLKATCPATPDNLTTTLTISSNDADETSKGVTVNLSCSDAATAPEISNPMPNPLELNANVNQIDTGAVTFENGGDADLTYNISESANWLEITSAASGTIVPGATATITLQGSCPTTPDTLSSTVAITSNDSDEPSKNVTVNLSCSTSGTFTIEVCFVGSGFTPARKQTFRNAANRWAEIITGDLPDGFLNKRVNSCGAGEPAINEAVDDLLIHAIIEPIDGQYGILGSAGPCLIRSSGNRLPVYGIMRFDSADVANMEASGYFGDVILHEMGHVLGIGTLWDGFGLLDYTTSPTGQACYKASSFSVAPTFNGAKAIAEFAALGRSGQPPVEDEFGPGARCGHWDESFFDTELMTGFAEATATPLSRLTAASLADLGYTTSLAAADPYSLPSCSPGCLRAQNKGHLIQETLLFPQGMMTPSGDITPFSPSKRE